MKKPIKYRGKDYDTYKSLAVDYDFDPMSLYRTMHKWTRGDVVEAMDFLIRRRASGRYLKKSV